MSTGLRPVPSKSLETHPNDSATLATLDFVRDSGRKLTIYETLQRHSKFPPAQSGVALALFSDYASVKNCLATTGLPALPALDADR